MLIRRNISKARGLAWFVLACTLACVLVLAMISSPAFAAEAGDFGSTTLGIRVTNSSSAENQGDISEGTALGIRVTNLSTPAPSTVTVTFNTDGGSAVNPQSVAPGGMAIEPTPPTKTNYAFGGWYTTKDFTTPYDFNTSVTTDFMLFAKWNPAYTIVFDNNNGTGSMEPMHMVRGEAKTLTANSFTRTGYKFTSWNTQSDGKGMTYTNGQENVDLTVDPGATVTLYAQWDLVISCEFPTAGVLEIDASGKVTDVTTGGTNTFRSGTVVPLMITEVESTKLEGANSLFANADTSGAKVVLTPPTGQGSVVEVPVANTKTPANFTIPAKEGEIEGQLALKFGLSLPPGISLTYLPDQYRSIVQLSYAVSVA